MLSDASDPPAKTDVIDQALPPNDDNNNNHIIYLMVIYIFIPDDDVYMYPPCCVATRYCPVLSDTIDDHTDKGADVCNHVEFIGVYVGV